MKVLLGKPEPASYNHDVINVCGIEYSTTEIEYVLPTFKS